MFAAIFLIVAVVIYRLVSASTGSEWANFSPMAAIVLCSAIFLPKRLALAVPLAAWAISEIGVNLVTQGKLFTAFTPVLFVAFAIIFGIGMAIRKKAVQSAPLTFGAAICGAILFFVITNTAAFAVTPEYPRSLLGWIQCLTVGLPGFPPSWVFFRNALVGDLFFTGLFLLAWHSFPTPSLSKNKAPRLEATS